MFDHRDRKPRRPASLSGALFALLCLATPALSQTVFKHVDENGVVSFSDVETEGAESMTLTVSEPPANAQQEQQALIEQQLTVAKALEESRLAREDARTRRMEAQAKAQPKTVYYREEDRNRYWGGGWGWGWSGHPRPPGRPVHPIAPPPSAPDSRPVPLPPLKGG